MKRLLFYLLVIVCFSLLNPLTRNVHAKNDSDIVSFFSQKEQVLVGGKAKSAGKNNAIEVETYGESWLSIPMEINKDGFYDLSLVKDGGGFWNILIDGEKYDGLNNISFKMKGETTFPSPLFLQKGRHSIIFHSVENRVRVHQWYSLKKTRLISQPARYIDTGKKWTILPNLFRRLEIGSMFSGSYINVNIARNAALFSTKDYQYISYYNPDGFLVVGRRRVGSGYFEKYWIPIQSIKAPVSPVSTVDFSLSDPHNFISMQIDGDGYLHLAFGQHCTNLKYIKSTFPYDVSQWDAPEKNMEEMTNEKEVTYVDFIKLKSGGLLAMFRDGVFGRGFDKLLKYDLETKQWSPLHSPFITDYGNSSPYFWKPIVSPDGTIHLAWTWRLSNFINDLSDSPAIKSNFGGFPNKNICYAKSPDEGKTWFRSDNTQYDLPINRIGDSDHRAEIIEEVPTGEDFFNHFGSDYDSVGNPHFTYSRWGNASERIPQQWHLYWSGEGWKKNPVTNYQSRFEWTRPQQDGWASTYLVRPNILLAKDNAAIVISRSKELDNIIEFYFSNGANYDSWKRIVAYNGSVGGWEPQYDSDLWHSLSKLNLILLGITDKAVKNAYPTSNCSNGSLIKETKTKIVISLARLLRSLPEPARKYFKTINIDYYSNNCNVEVQKIDSKLEENVGYILEVDYNNIKSSLNEE